MQFDIIIAGLDSISARRWINATLVQMVDEENPESLKPLIDGGTEGGYTSFETRHPGPYSYYIGFKGQARVILPTISSCYECSVSMTPSLRQMELTVRLICSLLQLTFPSALSPIPLDCQSTA